MLMMRAQDQTIIHPLSKPGARRPDKSYIVIRGNNVEAIQGYGSGPIGDFVQHLSIPRCIKIHS